MSTVKQSTRITAESAQVHPPTKDTCRKLQHIKPKLRNITNTFRMSTGDDSFSGCDSPAKKQKKDNPSHSKARSPPPNPEMVAFDKLRFVLGRHYFDVCQRLALDYVPRCVRNITECAQRHASKRSPRTKCVSLLRQMNTHDQLREYRPDQFIVFLNQAIMRREFIDSELFVAGLQLMLTFNRPSEELQVEYGAGEIVAGVGEALEKCLEHFPPCRWDLRSAYQRIVLGQLEAQCFGKCDEREGLFRNVLHLIEHYIETEQEKVEYTSRTGKPSTGGKRSEDDEFYAYNYNSWMLTNRLCYDFNRLSREERFHRLFGVLKILVKLLEMDFAMWILRNPTKTHQNLRNPSRGPLVAQLFWNGDHGSMNLCIKKLFQMFINVNALHYPEDDIAVVSRLLSIVTVAMNLSEFQHNDGQIQYPCVKDNSLHYARQFWKTLESSGYFSIPLCVATIHNLRSPFLRLRLSEHLLQKFHRNIKLSNVRSFFQLLLNRSWLDWSKNEPSDGTEQSSSSNIYPVLNPHPTRLKVCDINQKQYLDLLLTGLRAYCDMHQLPAYFREIMVQPTPEASSSTEQPASSKECPQEARIVPPTVPDERMIFQGITMSGEIVLEYRDDIKYLLLIEQQLKKLESSEDRILFQGWVCFLSEVDPSVTTPML
ncbi:uncharacterized protein LOC126560855 [Anopheles maculipalpis]|uniref:uncharacterized protein LOC126560855 n=1 Tax=Anopheles maculipalpis TaxID=1496333 RepID=UPI002158BA3D|nr:uncharacterized protein LOC126560855 [Anopheles maculipalpis]